MSYKPKICLVGEHPFGFSGNSRMMFAIASSVDQSKFDLRVFAATKPDLIPDHYANSPFSIIEGIDNKAKFCGEHLCQLIATNQIDVLVFIGLDCWAYFQVFKTLVQLHKEKAFIWCSIFPFDLIKFRPDWLQFLTPIDVPCVYSQYGVSVLKDHLPNIRYFRPRLGNSSQYKLLPKKERREERHKIFSTVRDDQFIFGFIGNNQWRKDPLRAIKAFFNVRKTIPDCVLYMHTEFSTGVFNIPIYIEDCGGKPGDIFLKQEGARFIDMTPIYNVIDCLVNTSLQEGLSLTLLEAMMCGCPVIAADNTAQSELIADGAGLAVSCTDLAFVPVQTMKGLSYVETKACNLPSLESAMIDVASKPELRDDLSKKGMERATKWLADTSDINVMLDEAFASKLVTRVPTVRKKGVLFAQHSSAGDVLMTTQCFKGIKERHKNQPLVYMTQKQYQDIVTGNPYVDEIIDWDEEQLQRFETIYNPHGERILKGRFNRLDVTLYSMYPHFCKVKADSIFIEEVDPCIDLPKTYAVVHTTGGDAAYRTYEHMDIIVNKIGMPCVQVGSKLDKVCRNVLDLRGVLSFRETAFVMKRARIAVVIDSFPSHLAGALGTPAIVLYGPAPARVTRPRDDYNKLINIEPNWLDVCQDAGMCWGSSINNSCTTPCINTISPLTILTKIKELLKCTSP